MLANSWIETFWNHLVSVRILFSAISCVELLKLIHVYVECTDSLYMHIKRLFVELDSYALTVFITERVFVTISDSVPYISPLLICSIWYNRTFNLILYMVSTCIHLYFHYLYDVCGVASVKRILGISVCHSHPVCVPIRSQIISYTHWRHMY